MRKVWSCRFGTHLTSNSSFKWHFPENKHVTSPPKVLWVTAAPTASIGYLLSDSPPSSSVYLPAHTTSSHQLLAGNGLTNPWARHSKQSGTGWGFGVSAQCQGFAQGNKSISTFLEFAAEAASPRTHKELLDYLRTPLVRPLKQEAADLHTVVAFQTVQEQLLRGFTHLCR